MVIKLFVSPLQPEDEFPPPEIAILCALYRELSDRLRSLVRLNSQEFARATYQENVKSCFMRLDIDGTIWTWVACNCYKKSNEIRTSYILHIFNCLASIIEATDLSLNSQLNFMNRHSHDGTNWQRKEDRCSQITTTKFELKHRVFSRGQCQTFSFI